MTKKKAPKKQRAKKYEEKVAIKGSFDDVLRTALKTPKKKK